MLRLMTMSNRLLEAAEEAYVAVHEMMTGSVDKIRAAGGDPRLKAEKFIVHMVSLSCAR